MTPSREARSVPCAIALALLGLTACGSGAGRGAPAAVRSYTVRAQVLKLPDAQARERQLALRHEAIDAFEDEAGKVVGMDAMAMKFAVAPGVSLDGVRVGDKVEVVLAVGWSPPTLRVDAVRRLPEETTLSFGKARPPGAAPR